MLAEFHLAAETAETGTPVRIDAGRVLSGMKEPQARKYLEALSRGDVEPRGMTLSEGVPALARAKVYAEKVRLPAAAEETQAFIDRIGGMEGFSQWHALSRLKTERIAAFDGAAGLLSKVMAADFVSWPDSGCDMLCHVDGDTFGEPETVLNCRATPFDGMGANWDGTSDRRQAWIRDNAAPFAWATVPQRWQGISPRMVLEILDDLDDDAPTADEIADALEAQVSSVLSDEHHEDAEDQLVDRGGIRGIVKVWHPHVGNLGLGRSLLARLCEDWNAKQVVVSYFANQDVAVGLHADASKEECVVFARRKAFLAAAKVADIDALWREPYSGDRKRLIESLSAKGVFLGQSHRSPGWEISLADGSRAFPTSELAVEHLGASM